MEREIISKAEAIERGLKTYFTGQACPRGHIAEIYVNGKCIECNRERNKLRPKKGKPAKTGKVTKSKAVAVIPRNQLYDGGAMPSWIARYGESVRKDLVSIEERTIRIADKLAKVKGASTPRGFKKFLAEFGIGRSRAYELLAIAGGRKTIEEVRAKGRERNKRFYDNRRPLGTDSAEVTESPVIEGKAIEVTPPPKIETARDADFFIPYTDDDAVLAGPILDWLGEERLSRLMPELQKLIRAASEAAA